MWVQFLLAAPMEIAMVFYNLTATSILGIQIILVFWIFWVTSKNFKIFWKGNKRDYRFYSDLAVLAFLGTTQLRNVFSIYNLIYLEILPRGNELLISYITQTIACAFLVLTWRREKQIIIGQEEHASGQ